MKTVLAILRRDMLIAPRRKWFYWKRLGLVLLAGLLVLWGVFVASVSQSTTVGLSIFRMLSNFVLFITCVLSGLMAGQPLAREKTDRTLGLLCLTDISRWNQVLGRYLASIFFTLITVISMFPMFVMVASLGGVSSLQIASAFLILMGVMSMGCCIGLFASSVTNSEKDMILLDILLCAFMFIVVPVIIFTRGKLVEPTSTFLLSVVSSFTAMDQLGHGRMLMGGVWNGLYSVLAGLPFLLLAGIFLTRGMQREGRGVVSKIPLRDFLRLKWFQAWARAPAISGNPVAWKDHHFLHNGGRAEWAVCLFMIVPAVLIIMAIVGMFFIDDVREAIGSMFFAVAATCGITFAITALFRASKAFNSEKLGRTMEILLMSDLPVEQIIRGKIRAVYQSSLPWLITALVSAFCFLVTIDEPEMFIGAIAVAVYGIVAVAAVCCLAFFLSLRFKTPAVLTICIFSYFGWSYIGKMFLMMFIMLFLGVVAAAMQFFDSNVGGFFAVLGGFAIYVGLDIVMGRMFISMLHKNFRSKALKEL